MPSSVRRPRLLELGAGAGNNACHLKAHFACTLTDIAEPMLALSRDRNPECEHVAGDMRTLRLGRVFDAVLVHDGVTYMTTEPDLRAAIETAFVHTRPGGAAIFTPDDLADTFVEGAELLEGDDGERSLRYIEWSWDPVPGDGKARAEYALLMRERGEVRVVPRSPRDRAVPAGDVGPPAAGRGLRRRDRAPADRRRRDRRDLRVPPADGGRALRLARVVRDQGSGVAVAFVPMPNTCVPASP